MAFAGSLFLLLVIMGLGLAAMLYEPSSRVPRIRSAPSWRPPMVSRLLAARQKSFRIVGLVDGREHEYIVRCKSAGTAEVTAQAWGMRVRRVEPVTDRTTRVV
ncbi:MAG: hypothetical protein AAF561_10960 [Planctomycetota bacterium]